MVYVLTVDQRASRSTSDLVPELLTTLNRRPRRNGLLRKFERTAGDEVQGVFSESRAAIDVVVELLRSDQWSVGLGFGEVVWPLPRSTRAGSGPAFVNAREAVTRAKSSPHHVNVVGENARAAEQAETVLWLMAFVLRRRSERGWAVADLLAEGLTRREIGVKLGISQSAVTQRAQAAGFAEEQRGRVLAAELLDAGAAA
ncbi:SatD family protein [Kribbella amoyensis]|uniref:SatD family protein n=1 Tax=Kribbella amoyensis TaxID=996641 RepID=A0A561BRJ5_9ACTN|nr:transposase [Kribbella amoyensis]TWD81504.1 SatD family protein [Kribbella amoyensis]